MSKSSLVLTRFLAAMALIGLVSCAAPLRQDQAKLTVSSNPPGATLTTGSLSGIAPQTWIVNNIAGSTTTTAPIRATWVSGATTTVSVTVARGQAQAFTIQRPSNAPGIDADIRWAVHLQQKDDAESAAAMSLIRGVNCTSTTIGITTTTNCR